MATYKKNNQGKLEVSMQKYDIFQYSKKELNNLIKQHEGKIKEYQELIKEAEKLDITE
jgi:hypothetical protein